MSNVKFTAEGELAILEIYLRIKDQPQSKSDKGLKKPGWTEIEKEMLVRFPDKNYKVKQIKAKFRRSVDKYMQYKYLSNLSGTGVDPDTGRVTMSDDAWARVIAEKPELKWHKSNTLLHVDLLALCVGDTRATGEFAMTANDLFNVDGFGVKEGVDAVVVNAGVDAAKEGDVEKDDGEVAVVVNAGVGAAKEGDVDTAKEGDVAAAKEKEDGEVVVVENKKNEGELLEAHKKKPPSHNERKSRIEHFRRVCGRPTKKEKKEETSPIQMGMAKFLDIGTKYFELMYKKHSEE